MRHLRKTTSEVCDERIPILSKCLPGRSPGAPFGVFRDGSMRYRIRNYYVDPEFQIEQLEQEGFTGVRVFSLLTGKELPRASLASAAGDPWIYYLSTLL